MPYSRAFIPPTNTPGTRRAFLIDIPYSEEFAALAVGALAVLSRDYNYEPVLGSIAPDAVAELWAAALVTARWEVSYIGQITAWINRADKIPEGFLACNGDGHYKDDYPLLWEVMPDALRTATTFYTPNLSGRSLVHQGTVVGGNVINSLNVPLGAETVTEINATMLAHSHAMPHTHGFTGTAGIQGIAFSPGELPVIVALTPAPGTTGGSSAVRTSSQGGGSPAANIPPRYPTNYLIRAR